MTDHPEFAALAAVMPVGILRTDADGRCVYMSERVTDLTGVTAEFAKAFGWQQFIHPDDREAVLGEMRSALQANESGQAEFRCVRPDGRMCWLLGQWAPERDARGHVAGFVWTLTDTTQTQEALRASEERKAFLLKLSDALRPLSDPLDMQAAAAQLVGEHLQVNRVGYAELRGQEAAIRREYVRGVAPLAGQGFEGAFGPAIADAFQRGETVVVSDVGADPRFTEPQRAVMRKREIAAMVGVTLVKGGRLVAAFGANNATPRQWTALEIELVRDVAERTWDALQRAHTEAALRLANLDLQESEERFSIIHDRAPFAISLTSVPDGRIVSVNDAFEQLFEFAREEVLGKTRVELGISNPALNAEIVEKLERNRLVRDFEVRRQTKSGAERILLLSIDPVKIADRDFLLTTAVDVTEKKHADAMLREREWRLRLALDASAAGSWTWDARTNQVDWDDAFRVRYGFPPEEPPTFDAWLGRVHVADRPQVLALLDEMLRTPKEAWDNTFRIVLPDGTVSWIQSLGRAERAADGQVLRLTGLELNVTERRRAEQAREARLDEERDRELRLLLETATQGIVSVDVHGTIVMANRALEAMFGWDAGTLAGQSLERLVPPTFRELHMQHRGAYFAGPRPRQMGVDSDLFGQRRDGTIFPIEVTLNHVATPGGGRALAFVTDITARKQAEVALRERTVELERRTAQLSQLASDLTLAEHHAREQLARTLHDGLQQLLVSAALNLDRQLRGSAKGDPRREGRRDGKAGAAADELIAQAKGQIDEAITAARSLSLELFPPVLHSSGLPAALTWLADRTRHEYGLAVQVSVDPRANSDRKDVRTLLFESVRELLFNAVKHARVDRIALHLVLESDDTLCITVADRGVGFDPATLADRAKAGQAGWGLFSIRERVTLLGGRLDIDSAPGQGTRFRLIVPRGEAHAAAPGPSTTGRTATVATLTSARALRILIVDDHAAVRKAFRELLEERSELRVVGEAANGLEAIAEARALRPDVILMDISMPGMDGVEATRRIRAELPYIEILGLSTHLRGDGQHAIEQAGGAGFFTKGVDTQRLVDHLMLKAQSSVRL
jgi:PAS domain S-box-containing protein